MRNGGFTGWAAALLLALLSGFLLIRLQERTGELANLRAEMGRLEAAAQETAKSLESLRTAVDQIQKQAAPPAATAAQAPAATSAVAGEKPVAAGPDLTRLLSGLVSQRQEEGTMTSGDPSSSASSSDMPKEEELEAMLEELAEMGVLQLFDPWISEMAFPPEVEAQVRAVFLEYQKARQKKDLLDFPDDDSSAAMELPTDDTLRQQLAEIVGPEAMAAYDTYIADGPVRKAEDSADMQLFEARGLSPEGRALFRAALVEETLASEQSDPATPEEMTDLDAFLESSNVTYDHALERSRENLSAHDLLILESLGERNRRMHEILRSNFASEDAPKSE